MGLLARVHHRAAAPSTSGDPFSGLYGAYYPPEWAGSLSEAGIVITPERAMTLSAIWAGVRFLSTNLGSLPCVLYEYLDGSGKDKDRARRNPLYDVLRWQPNLWQTAIELFEMLIGHALLRGTAYAQIIPGQRGFVDQLIPRHPDRVWPERLPSGRVRYRLIGGNEDGSDKWLTQDEMFVIRGFSSDGLRGMSLTAYLARSLGAAVAADTFAAMFFKNGVSAAVAAVHPGTIGGDAMKNLQESYARYAQGVKNAGGLFVLEENMAVHNLGIKPEEMQLLPTREHAVREAARALGLPVHVLSDAGKPPTYASIEMFGLELVIYAFRPWAVRIEQAIRRDLILNKERFFAEFLMDAFLRGDSKSRSQFYKDGILTGWMSRQEARAKENMNAGPDALDEFFEPTTMTIAGEDEEDRARASRQRDLDGQDRAQAGLQARGDVRATLLAIELAARVVKREVGAVTGLARKHANDGAAWSKALREFYADHAGYVSSALKISKAQAQEYCGRQGLLLERDGIGAAADFETTVVTNLATWALEPTYRWLDVDEERRAA